MKRQQSAAQQKTGGDGGAGLVDLAVGGQPRGKRKSRSLLAQQQKPSAYPVPPTSIVSLIKPRNVANHSYRDFSHLPPRSCTPPPPGGETFLNDAAASAANDEMTFPQKLHSFVSDPTNHRWVEWRPHGRAFRIIQPAWLEQSQAFLRHFGIRRFSVICAMLDSYGFKHITSGRDRNCFYHELFLQGLPHLIAYFEDPKDPRRLLPNPEEEPDFYAISETFPVPAVAANYDGGGYDHDTASTTTERNAGSKVAKLGVSSVLASQH